MKKIILGIVSLITVGSLYSIFSIASDHDDGETDLKGRSLNLTDLYVFREDGQSGLAADSGNLVFIMNTNPRSLARQQYFFSTKARYEFHISRKASASSVADGTETSLIRFEFGNPDSQQRQPITMTFEQGGKTYTSQNSMLTTNLANSSGDTALLINNTLIEGHQLSVFAGLREDPFFFDVEAFFRLRAAALGKGPVPTTPFRSASQAQDFTAGYNVNSIVVRVPIQLLQGNTSERVFDVWETISIQQ